MRTIAVMVVAIVALSGCDGMSLQNASSITDAQYQEQVDAYNRQTEQLDKHIAEQAASLERAERLNDRYELLLTKWEEQARRKDALLDAAEKKAGLKP